MKCPKCGAIVYDVYSAPSCEEGPVIIHCGNCGNIFPAEEGIKE